MLQRTQRNVLPDWSHRFADPIPVPNGKPLLSLRDAAHYITSLPKAEQAEARWQTATEMLLLNAEHGGDLMFARIAMMKALHRRDPRPASAARRKLKALPDR